MTDGDAAGRLELAGVELPDDRVLGSPPAGNGDHRLAGDTRHGRAVRPSSFGVVERRWS